MKARFAGRVAVVTGGGSGIGRATALRFLAEGARVIIADVNPETGRETITLAGEAGRSDMRFVEMDVTRESDVQAGIACAVEEFGRIDCLFNNAGVPGAVGPIEETQVEDWDFTFAVLCRSVFLGIKHGARAMRRQGEGGVILNTASIAGVSGGCGPVAYSAAKAGVISLTRSAASELAIERIRVNAICPGAILTPMAHRGDPDAFEKSFAAAQPWPEPGRAEDVAAVALFLASSEARFITGEALLVDGGALAAGVDLLSRVARVGPSPLSLRPGVDYGTTRRLRSGSSRPPSA